MKVKICGLRRQCDIEYVNELLPDYIGFIFAEKSRRYVAPAEAAKLKAQLDPPDQSGGSLRRCACGYNRGPGGAKDHRCGAAPRRRGQRIYTRAPGPDGLSILKAFLVRGAGDVRAAEQSPGGLCTSRRREGSGSPFDWPLVRDITRPYFLAGGLNPDNLREAIRELRPYAVDVSSGVETGGWKDYDKIRRFMEICSEQQERRGKQ